MRKKTILAIILFFVCLSQVGLAGLDTWTPTQGPEGGQIYAAAIDLENPNIVYAAAARYFAAKIFKTTDGGKSWSSLTVLQGGPSELAIDRMNTSTLYLAGGGGIYKSNDAGITWITVNKGLPELSISSIAIDPQNSNVLYAGGYAGLFKSTDAGANWTTLQVEGSIRSIVIDPANPSRLYAAGNLVGPSSIIKSEDGGSTWNRTGIGQVDIVRLVINIVNPSNLFAFGGRNCELYSTYDSGISWSTITTNGIVTAVGIDLSTGLNVYAGIKTSTHFRIFRSTDQGITWKKARGMGPLSSEITSFLFNSESSSTIFASTVSGMFKTINSGRSWTLWNSGLNAVNTFDIAISKLGTLYAGTIANGLFKSTNAGKDWKYTEGLPGTEIPLVEIDPTKNKILYASVFGGPWGLAKGIFKTEDSGSTWRSINGGLNQDIDDIKVAPSKSKVLYASSVSKIYKSTDGGETWQATNWSCDGGGIVLAVDPIDPDRVIAGYGESGTWTGAAYSLTTDGGITWECGSNPGTVPNVIAIDPSNRQTIYIGGYDGGPYDGGEDGLFKSTNGGGTWSKVMNGLPEESVFAFGIDPHTTTTVYVALRTGVFKSIDGGNNWTLFNSGLENISVRSIVVDPADTNIVYAATSLGVFSIEQFP
jgi:photosystem II stability/assembly factor-like uncharacterized protein